MSCNSRSMRASESLGSPAASSSTTATDGAVCAPPRRNSRSGGPSSTRFRHAARAAAELSELRCLRRWRPASPAADAAHDHNTPRRAIRAWVGRAARDEGGTRKNDAASPAEREGEAFWWMNAHWCAEISIQRGVIVIGTFLPNCCRNHDDVSRYCNNSERTDLCAS